MTPRWSAMLVLPALIVAEGLGAQTVELAQPEAAFDESYSLIQNVRELPDGRVMWADPLGQALVVANLSAGTADTIGQVGQGPEEYRQPDAVWPLPGDSTLLVDLGNGRLTAVGPDGTFGQTWSIGMGDPGPGMLIALPRGVDDTGHLYITGRMSAGRGPPPDSQAVLRLDRATQAVDTVAMVKLPERIITRSGSAGQESISIQMVPLSPADAWGVSADGRVIVARSGDYHLEIFGADGSMVAGSAVDYDAVRIGQAEKEEWARDRERTGGGLSIGMSVNNGVASMSLSRGGSGAGRDDDLDQYEWPDRKGPFYDGSISVDPAGRAWVRRHRDAGEAPMYDLFGRDGEHVGSVALPKDRRLVGFGDGTLYAVYMDEFDLNYLERYAQPDI